jgi:predicted ATPase
MPEYEALFYAICEKSGLAKVLYNEVEHVSLTRSFLNNPESYLKHL